MSKVDINTALRLAEALEGNNALASKKRKLLE